MWENALMCSVCFTIVACIKIQCVDKGKRWYGVRLLYRLTTPLAYTYSYSTGYDSRFLWILND